MASKLPAIVLEEIEHHLDDITCSDSAVSLRFADVNSRTRLHGELSVDNDFYIVTSHAGCNKEGERAVYRYSTSNQETRSRHLLNASGCLVSTVTKPRTLWSSRLNMRRGKMQPIQLLLTLVKPLSAFSLVSMIAFAEDKPRQALIQHQLASHIHRRHHLLLQPPRSQRCFTKSS